MPISVNNKEIVAINCEGREIVRAHAGLSLVFSKQEDLYGGMDISSIADLVMFRDLINTGTCIWNGVSTNTYKGNPIATGGLGSTWYVTTDIDMSSVCSSSLGSWVPIGTSARKFQGTIQGLNFTISNLYIANTATYQALFGYANGAKFYDLNLTNISVSSGGYAAGLVSSMSTSTAAKDVVFSNCSVSGAVAGANDIGGLCANLTISTSGQSIVCDNCKNYCTISSTNSSRAGGLFGYFSVGSTITSHSFADNTNNGTLNCTTGYVGGLFGLLGTPSNTECTILRGQNNGNILNNTGDKAGICSYAPINSTSRLIFTDCINNGEITGSRVAGFVALGNYFTFNNCTNNGNTYGYGIYNGGFCGQCSNYTFNNCTNTGNLTCAYTSTMYGGGFCAIVSQSTSLLSFINCTNTGNIISYNPQSAYFSGFIGHAGTVRPEITYYNCENSGYIYSPSSGGYGGGLLGYTNGNYPPTVNVELCKNSGKIEMRNVYGLVSYVAGGSSFTDCINTGELKCTTGSGICGGITGAVDGIVYLRCSLAATINNTGNFSGIAERASSGSEFNTCTIEASTTTPLATGNIWGISYGGGGDAGVFINCVNYAALSAIQVYGIAESPKSATGCYNYGNLTGSTRAMGLFNYVTGSGTFSNCHNIGNITANSTGYASGIFGTLAVAFDNCTNSGTISSRTCAGIGNTTQSGSSTAVLTNAINNGTIVATGQAGGILSSSAATLVLVSNCINNGAITGGDYCAGLLASVSSGEIQINSCTNNGAITGGQRVGGLVAGASAKLVLTNSRNNGNVSGANYIGGAVASVGGYKGTTITNVTSKAVITSVSQVYTGALFGIYDATGNTISSNYYDNIVETVYKGVGYPTIGFSYDIAGEAEGTTLP